MGFTVVSLGSHVNSMTWGLLINGYSHSGRQRWISNPHPWDSRVPSISLLCQVLDTVGIKTSIKTWMEDEL